jgi:hypothetical protein
VVRLHATDVGNSLGPESGDGIRHADSGSHPVV